MHEPLLRGSVTGPLLLITLVLISLTYLHRSDPITASSTPPSTPPAAQQDLPTAPRTHPAPLTPPPEETATDHRHNHADTTAEHIEPLGTPIDPTTPAIPRDQHQAALFTQAQTVAQTVLAAFARPDPSITAQQWWTTLAGYLSADAQHAYTGTDPQQVPYTSITEPAVILATTDPQRTLTARARTDTGYYQVHMRSLGGHLWVESITAETTIGPHPRR